MSSVQERLAKLSPEKRAQLADRLAKQNALTGDGNNQVQLSIDPDNRYEPFPMLDLQQAYWIGRGTAFDMGGIASKAYIELTCVNLDYDRLSQTWNLLIGRHDMLRLIILEDGQQKILEDVPEYEIRSSDLANLDKREAAEHLEATREDMLSDSRDTAEWPLFDIRVSRMNGNQSSVHVCLDLLNVDAGSIAILMREWGRLYTNPQERLKELTLSFRDYVVGLKSLTDSAESERSKAYWLNRVDDFPSGPELPLAKEPALVERPKFTRRRKVLGAETWATLKATANQKGITSTGLLLAVYGEILSTWSGNSHLAINIPIFNRMPVHAEVDDIVGAFTSVILLEINNSARDSFEVRAKRVQEQLMSDLDHRHYDGVQFMRKLARASKGKASANMPVVFTSLIEQRFDDAFAEIGTIADSVNQTAQVWMDLHVDEHEGALILKWDSVDELFPIGLADEMLCAYHRVLKNLADDARSWRTVCFNLLPGAQSQRRDQNNATAIPIPSDPLHVLIKQRADGYPERSAVIADNRSLTYSELRQISVGIGARLRSLGATVDSLVAIITEKGWEQIAGVLGILESGAAYLPIDPNYPESRINHLLDHGQVSLVLTQSRLKPNLNLPEGMTCLCIDDQSWETADVTPLAPLQEPQSLAYVLYTSGSTGSPKGAMITHENVVNRMLDINQRFEIGLGDRVIAMTALQHDLSVYDIFGTLLAGATVVIPIEEERTNPAYLADLMRREHVTIWNSVPAFFEMLVDYLEHTPKIEKVLPADLRLVILAGDWIPVSLPDRIWGLKNDVKFIASGGPTETTIWDIWNEVRAVDPAWKSIPYGRPLANSRYYILHENLQPCPDLVIGEMYIGGLGLARGYWRDEQRTSASFITHPDSGERLYRSGDLGRFLPDGNIEFIGRSDFQLKIRGYRIEPGEIESALKKNSEVREAVVAAIGNQQADRRLVAYVVPATSEIDDNLNDSDQSRKKDSEVITDPIERVEFKLNRLGIRHNDVAKPTIELFAPESVESLRERFLTRQSYRIYSSDVVPFNDFSEFIACLRQVEFRELPVAKALYPSGGGLYPVQAYLYVQEGRIEGVPGGTYYYNPASNRLVLLKKGAVIDSSIHTRNNHPIHDSSAFSIFLVYQEKAIVPLYGKDIRDFCMIEAGYMGQLLMTSAPQNNIGIVHIAGGNFSKIRNLFDLDDGHVYVCCLIGGRIEDEKKKYFSLLDEAEAAQKNAADAAIKAKPALNIDGLRTYLETQVPKYMVPSAFVVLDRLPLTKNGKVNRQALPDPFDLEGSSKEYVAPESDFEKIIAKFWQEATGIERIGVKDNFFDLGGHSISAVQVITRIERETGIRLKPRSMVSDTLEQIAKAQSDFKLGQDVDKFSGAEGSKVPESDARGYFEKLRGLLFRD